MEVNFKIGKKEINRYFTCLAVKKARRFNR